jgi:hypothetical protein
MVTGHKVISARMRKPKPTAESHKDCTALCVQGGSWSSFLLIVLWYQVLAGTLATATW